MKIVKESRNKLESKIKELEETEDKLRTTVYFKGIDINTEKFM